MEGVGWRVRGGGCGMEGVGWRVWDVGCGMEGVGWRVWDGGVWDGGEECKVLPTTDSLKWCYLGDSKLLQRHLPSHHILTHCRTGPTVSLAVP